MSDSLRIELEHGVALLTLARPARRNALSRELLGVIRGGLEGIVEYQAVSGQPERRLDRRGALGGVRIELLGSPERRQAIDRFKAKAGV